MTKVLHRTLIRQLKKSGLRQEEIPESFLKLISESYQNYDDQIIRLNHISEINERELIQKNSLIEEVKNKEFEAVLNRIPGYVSWISNDLTYLGVNSNLMQMLGMTKESIIGKKVGDVLKGQDKTFKDGVQNFISSSLEEDHFEFELIIKEKKFNIITYLQKFDEGKKIILVGIDITEKTYIQKELDEARALENHKSRLVSLGEISAGIAHEINNPLMIVTGNCQLIKKDIIKLNSDQNLEILLKISKAEEAIKRISKILSNLKLLSRNIENDDKDLTLLTTIVNNSLELIFQKTIDRKIQITVDVEKDIKINCHISELMQVFHNLFNNAIDSIDMLPDQWLKVEGKRKDKKIIIKVIDCGNGIDKKIVEKLFQPFFTTKSLGNGTGLGLSISQNIVKKHNGLLYYEPNYPNTCFVIELEEPKQIGDNLL